MSILDDDIMNIDQAVVKFHLKPIREAQLMELAKSSRGPVFTTKMLHKLIGEIEEELNKIPIMGFCVERMNVIISGMFLQDHRPFQKRPDLVQVSESPAVWRWTVKLSKYSHPTGFEITTSNEKEN